MQPLIPVDVMVAILEHVDRSDLPSLCRVNKIVCRYSQDVLYRHVDLSAANVMRACCTICNAPDLASRVTSFSLRGDADVSSYLGVVQDVFAIMTRLRTLKLFIGPHGSWILPEPKACPFRLHSFACGFVYNSELVTFLNGQSELKVISAMLCNINADERYRVHFGPTSFPNLTRLSAPLSLLQKLIVGRPVRDVVTYSDDRDPTLLHCLSRSTAPNGIQRLEINLKYLRSVRRTHLASILPGLSYLTVTARDVDPEDDETGPALANWVAQLLSILRALHCFTIQFDPIMSVTPWSEMDFSPLVTKAFESAPNLHYFIVTFFRRRDAGYTCKRVPGQKPEEWFVCDSSEAI